MPFQHGNKLGRKFTSGPLSEEEREKLRGPRGKQSAEWVAARVLASAGKRAGRSPGPRSEATRKRMSLAVRNRYERDGPPRPKWKNTSLERALWKLLSAAGYSFETEKRFGRSRVDVYLPDYHLAFEADGWHHTRPGRAEADQARDDELMRRFKLPVVRLSTADLAEV